MGANKANDKDVACIELTQKEAKINFEASGLSELLVGDYEEKIFLRDLDGFLEKLDAIAQKKSHFKVRESGILKII
ncbi:MAG: hypothetical protein ACOH5I_16990 [Oligoflexus sp.]